MAVKRCSLPCLVCSALNFDFKLFSFLSFYTRSSSDTEQPFSSSGASVSSC